MAPAPVALLFLLRATSSGSQQVLLGLKKTGFGKGKIVGIGGHIEAGESPEEAAVREMFEETTVRVHHSDLNRKGSVAFRFPTNLAWDMDAEIFTARSWTGEPVETEEIQPQWHFLDDLPASQMWEDAGHWLPMLLAEPEQHFMVRIAADNEAVDEVIRVS